LNPGVNFRYFLLSVVFLGACAGPSEPLVVKQFLLRDQELGSYDESMVRLEKSRRLRGAVSMEERRLRLGQYYTMLWHDPAGVGRGDVQLVFEYQQGATGSLVKKVARRFPASESQGRFEFSVTGEDYFKGGKVLAWKATLLRGGKVISTRQSYLWE
jgi:hypothetical protein